MKIATRGVAVGTASILLALSGGAVASAAPTSTPAAAKFSSCKALNAKHAGGVAKSAKAKNTKTVKGKKVAASSTYSPKVSASLYKTYKGLDRDGDGIACER